jgi:hypothetical protein
VYPGCMPIDPAQQLPMVYVHLAPDGRLLDARTEAPVSWETTGGRVHKYVPLVDWLWSDGPGFELPQEERAVVVKVMTTVIGKDVPDRARYAVYPSWTSRPEYPRPWGRWGWKYLES